jgi:LPS export ABC transporter permease LptG
MLFEGHDRIARALFSIFPPLIGAACLMLGHFSRFGVWRQILLAVVLVVPLQVIWNASEAAARADAKLWYLAYAQPLAAFVVAMVLIAGQCAARVVLGVQATAPAGHGGAMILHLYIARRFLRSLGIVIAVFVGILLPIDIAEQMRRVGGDHGLGAVVELSLLNLPRALYQWLPLFVMLATLILFLGLARTSELVVVRGAGRSAIRSAASPVLVAFGIGVLALLILNPIVAATSREYQMTVARYQGAEQRTVSVSAEGLWLRQGTLSEQTVIHAEGTNSDGTHLFDANFFTFDANGLLTDRISAEEALLVGGAWELQGVKVLALRGRGERRGGGGLPRQARPALDAHRRADPRQFRAPLHGADLRASGLHRAAQRRRVRGASAPHLAADAAQQSADAVGHGPDRRGLHHAAYALRSDRNHGSCGDFARFWGVFHPRFRGSSWGERAIARRPRRVGAAGGGDPHGGGCLVAYGRWVAGRISRDARDG